MIVVCKKCYTPFLVPDSLLHERGKTVKCGKCGHKWVEVPIRKEPPHPSIIKEAFQAPKKEIIKHAKVIKEKIQDEAKEAFSIKNLIKHFKIAFIAITILFFLSIIGFLTGHQFIVAQWPTLQKTYIAVGWVKEERELLILKEVSSKRAYKDGAMQLMLHGKIYSNAHKTQVIPEINANAIGVDGSIIESWRIKPPRATLRPGKIISFSSINIAPEGTVTKINLSFAEKPHDKE